MASNFLAQQTGEPLKHAIRDAVAGQQVNFGEHPDQGNTAFLFALASYGVVVVVALAATTVMVIAGHSGAILAWRDVGTLAHG